MRTITFLSLMLSISVVHGARSSWNLFHTKPNNAGTDSSFGTGYVGPYKGVLDKTVTLHTDPASGLGKLLEPTAKMAKAIGFVLDHFGPVVVFSDDGSRENWSMTLRKRPPKVIKLGRLRIERPTGWGLFFDYSVEGSSSRSEHSRYLDDDDELPAPQHIDLTNASNHLAFLRGFSNFADRVPSDAVVSALFSFLETNADAIPNTADPNLNGKLEKRTHTRMNEIETKYNRMRHNLSTLDLEKIAQRGRILVAGKWHESDHDFNDPKVAYFVPGAKGILVSGFRANHGEHSYNLNQANDRFRFASLYPVLFNRLDRIVVDKYDDMLRLDSRIDRIKNGETGKTITTLGHPAFNTILEKASPEEGPILVGSLPKSKDSRLATEVRLSMKLTRTSTGKPELIVVDQADRVLRRLTNQFPQTSIEAGSFEEAEREVGSVPAGPLIEFVRRHNEATRRGSFSVHDLSKEDPRGYANTEEGN